MLVAISALTNYSVDATDGRVGTVKDFLFDDRDWRIRWMAVDARTWLTGRKVLVHPSAIKQADHERERLGVALTKAQVESSPNVHSDEPVSMQMESRLHDHYGWDPEWGSNYFAGGTLAAPLGVPPLFSSAAIHRSDRTTSEPDAGDPHLRSFAEVTGYHIHASDGEIGHVDDFLVDDASWDIRYFLVDTRNWWLGQHVLLAPYAVREITWPDQRIWLNVDRSQVKASPPWDPFKMIDEAYAQGLHRHYGWPGYRY